jgi:vitamin B12 transporter
MKIWRRAQGAKRKGAFVFGCLVSLSIGAKAQDTGPTTLGAVIVTAERSATPMNRSTAATTRLTAADLAALPNASLADVLTRVPGFAVVNFDGVGRDPQLMVRGFYGGGEADYVLVMVDGRVMNLAHNGTIAWETLPALADIESIEIVRGSASALHGDAAVAGVINIVTRRPSVPGTTWRATAESMVGLQASATIADSALDVPFHASVGVEHTNGFREHAERTSVTANGLMRFSSMLSASLRGSRRDFDEPGPLLESLLGDGSENDPRFRFDGGRDHEIEGILTFDSWLGSAGTTHTTFRAMARDASLVRTLPLSPDFADTRERKLRSNTYGVTTQAGVNANVLPVVERATVGASLDIGSIDSRYFSGITDGQRTLDAQGDGRRVALGLFAHFVDSPNDWLRWTLGLRADWLNDTFEGSDASHFAFSPKAGVNMRYAPTGHAWLSASRTFKAPTLDQLFDQRPIPIPFPPFTLTTSNPDLDPQRGTSLEAGVYHDATVGNGRLSLTMTLYQIAMKDELDFDLQTFRYVNIAESRHRGAETGLSFAVATVSAFASLTLQDAVARVGDNAGNQLKAIPGQLVSTGITLSPPRSGTLTLSLTRMADMYIDDANTRRIPAWTRVDAQASRAFGAFEVVLGARNLLDARINSTGFLDPAGSGEAYWYPAAGRVITLGVRHGR